MKSNRNNNGRWIAVRDIKTGNSIVEAIIVDAAAPRVRLQTADHFGEARTAGQSAPLEFLEPAETTNPLARAMAEQNEP